MRLRTPAFGQQKMNTYLITWNPKVWPWVTLEDKRQGHAFTFHELNYNRTQHEK